MGCLKAVLGQKLMIVIGINNYYRAGGNIEVLCNQGFLVKLGQFLQNFAIIDQNLRLPPNEK